MPFHWLFNYGVEDIKLRVSNFLMRALNIVKLNNEKFLCVGNVLASLSLIC